MQVIFLSSVITVGGLDAFPFMFQFIQKIVDQIHELFLHLCLNEILLWIVYILEKKITATDITRLPLWDDFE